jgi:hypothetical protein
MNQGRTVFSQLISFLPDREFRRCVARYEGDLRRRGFTCWDQYLAMAFAQLTYRESLRDIEACLGSLQGKLYHLGLRGKVARSTLAEANESRDWRIFADFALCLVTILSGCEINNFAGSRQSRSAITWLLCLTCFDSGSEPCFACFGRRRSLMLENLALRQQLTVFKRQQPRPRLGAMDKHALEVSESSCARKL